MLWDDFLNSDYHDWRGGGRSEDRLDKPGWLSEWLSGHELPDPGPPSVAERAALKQLRSVMLGIVKKLVDGRAVSPEDADELNRSLQEGPFIRQLVPTDEGFRLDSVPVRADWQGIRARIVSSFCEMLTGGEVSRLRICENPDCLWVYYDETRNRSKRFCDDRMCGNLMKVRRFRARQRQDRQ